MREPTPEQAAIVEHPLEPLRVTAGAGTGKTTTMAWRLASLVDRRRVAVDRSLGITFTNKAAEELAASIRSELGEIGSNAEPEITTYHGFAFGIVREFGPLARIPRTVRVATPGYVRQLLRDALGARPRTHLDLTRPGAMVDRLASLASSLGDHLRRPGDLTTGLTLGEERSEIADVLETFARRKSALGLVDYADLVAVAHAIVSEHDRVATRIRGRYDVVLLDEYQDTNAGQRALLLELFGGGFPVTAVGDTDQTIYEWRGASLQNFERFPDHFVKPDGSPAPSLELSRSWRCGSVIVDVANAARAQIATRGPLEQLRAQEKAEPGRVRAHWLRTSVAEASWIAEEVRRLHDEDERAWSDIALLFRKHRHMSTIRDALVAADVPIEVASLGGLLDVPEVADLHAWLRILGRPDDAPALARLLLGSRYRLGLGDLAPLAAWVRTRHRGSEEASIGWAMLEAVDSLESVPDMRPEARRRLAGFRAEYRDLLEVAQSVSLVELCRRILDRTGAWPEIEAMSDAARLSARLNTYRFLDLAEDWSPLDGGPSLTAFLDHLDVLAEEASAEQLDTARVSGEDAVALLTVHRAKGLEWPVVFLPALSDGVFPSRVVRYEDPTSDALVLPYELRLDAADLPTLTDDRDENRRVLRAQHQDAEWRTAYVAVTRAADELIATGAYWYTPRTWRNPSPLFETVDRFGEAVPGRCREPGDPPDTLRPGRGREASTTDPLFESGHLPFLTTATTDPAAPARMATELGIRAQYDAEVEQLGMELAGLPDPLEPVAPDEPFRASVSGLVTLAACPQRYRWEHVDRLPRRPSAAARRGLDLHRRIELHHRGTLTLEEATEEFYDVPTSDRGGTAGDPFDRFAASRFADERPMLVEAPFELRVDGGVLSGRIDAVYERSDGDWEIVDFKSGRPREDPALRVQLQAYAVAAHEALLHPGHSPENSTVTFAYFGGEAAAEHSENVDAAWLATARTRLRDLMALAADGPQDPAPGPHCGTCDFTRFCPTGQDWLAEASA